MQAVSCISWSWASKEHESVEGDQRWHVADAAPAHRGGADTHAAHRRIYSAAAAPSRAARSLGETGLLWLYHLSCELCVS